MDKLLHTSLLYDFYSELLTEKQRRFFVLYYFENLSTLEIGEANGVTPQAVWDLLKRTEQLLKKYESKLFLVERHLSKKNDAAELSRTVDEIINGAVGICPEVREKLEILKALTARLVD